MVDGPASRGRLVVVGTGIRSIAQLTLEAAAWIRAADIVCYALADPVTQRWVLDNAKQAEDLAVYYDESANRLATYDRMAARLVAHARAGRTVVGAFYGHPGIFTDPSHQAVAIARAEGIEARMLPGISAEDCLFADLGIDPGLGASESYEATEMLVRGRHPDATSHVVVWQIGVLGQQGFDSAEPTSPLQPLVDHLLQTYPPDHLVTHYQGAQLVLCDSLIQRVPLAELAGRVAAVACNPPYIPADCVPRDPEVAEHDPVAALYGGADGLDVVREVLRPAAALLRRGGVLAIEHGDAQGVAAGPLGVPATVVAAAEFHEVQDVEDLTGRPRVTLARRR